MENDDKRAIDDPGLNQDSTYDKKDDTDFDASDDFHKNDDTDEDKKPEEKEAAATENSKIVVNKDGSHLNDGTFTGEITI